MTAVQLALGLVAPERTCSHYPCRQAITRSGICDTHRAQIDPEYLARFDAAWDNEGREDWFKMTLHLYGVWWANDRGTPVPVPPSKAAVRASA